MNCLYSYSEDISIFWELGLVFEESVASAHGQNDCTTKWSIVSKYLMDTQSHNLECFMRHLTSLQP